MSVSTTADTSESDRGGPARTWGWYVLVAYPVVFVLGTVSIGIALAGTDDPTLFSAGLTAGFIAVTVSAVALLTYPAYRAEWSQVRERGGRLPAVRRYVALGLGVPLAVGVLFEIAGSGMDSGNVPGFVAAFVAVVVHPVVAFVATLGYLVHRHRAS